MEQTEATQFLHVLVSTYCVEKGEEPIAAPVRSFLFQ